jgi:response regulator RpfG family c-di-GMP phosphodiesterase
MKSGQHRVLCIDNHASSNLAVYLLERVGYEVKTASSIADGIKLAQSEPFDLQLINHRLVDGSEIDSCDKLHKFAIRTPILFYSTVSYPYEQIQSIHCREHRHTMEPVYVYDVAGHASRLIKKTTGSVERPLRQECETKTTVEFIRHRLQS